MGILKSNILQKFDFQASFVRVTHEFHQKVANASDIMKVKEQLALWLSPINLCIEFQRVSIAKQMSTA